MAALCRQTSASLLQIKGIKAASLAQIRSELQQWGQDLAEYGGWKPKAAALVGKREAMRDTPPREPGDRYISDYDVPIARPFGPSRG